MKIALHLATLAVGLCVVVGCNSSKPDMKNDLVVGTAVVGGGVRDPSTKPIVVSPVPTPVVVNPAGGLRDPSIKPVARTGVPDDGVRPVIPARNGVPDDSVRTK